MRPHPPHALADGRYQLVEQIGEGGSASVYRAVDTRLDAVRAIKLLPPVSAALQEEQFERVLAEAHVMARLNHPHVLPVHDMGVQDGWAYLVMDLAKGGSLHQQLGGRPLDRALVTRWMLDVLSALAVAHAHGVVHRDVKPGNILLDEQGHIRLADFGVALLGERRRTQHGTALGTLTFMPPEQRLDAASVSHRADLYAVGATLYFLLTKESPDALYLASPDSERWASLPPRLAHVIRRACAAKAEDRYPSAGAMARALGRGTVSSLDLGPGRYPSPRSPGPARGQRPTLVPDRTLRLPDGFLPAVGLCVVGVVAAVGWTSRPELRDAPATEISEESIGLLAPSGPAWPNEPAVRAPAPDVRVPAEAEPPEPAARPDPKSDDAKESEASGRWTMSANGVAVSLVISGADRDLQGAIRSELGGRSMVRQVVGTYQPQSRRLRLSENDGPSYDLTLAPDGQSGTGVTVLRGRQRFIAFERSH